MISSSPFTPWRPVPGDLLTGRAREIEALQELLDASSEDDLRVGFVSGEPGVGKSSLASFFRNNVERESEVVGCHVHLDGVSDMQGLMAETLRTLLRDSADRPWRRKALKFFGDRVQRTGPRGLTLDLRFEEGELRYPDTDFLPTLRRFLRAVKRYRGALLLILDDVNGLAGSLKFANWIKTAVDTTAVVPRKQNMKICLVVIGTEAEKWEIVDQEPSVAVSGNADVRRSIRTRR